MSILAGQIAFEIDEAERLATVVYLGPITDQQALEFYRAGHIDGAVIAGFRFMIDMRHTHWQPAAATVHGIAEHVRLVQANAGVPQGALRIAAVRRDNSDVHSVLHGGPMRQEFGADRFRYFESVAAARAWLLQEDSGGT